jgi:hypothetical protein
MKPEIIYVQPKSVCAKIDFEELMHFLHACKVEKRLDGRMLVSSISGNLDFWISEKDDCHWEIIK